MRYVEALKLADCFIAEDAPGNRPTEFEALRVQLGLPEYTFTERDNPENNLGPTPYNKFLAIMRAREHGEADLYETQWRLIALIKEITT